MSISLGESEVNQQFCNGFDELLIIKIVDFVLVLGDLVVVRNAECRVLYLIP